MSGIKFKIHPNGWCKVTKKYEYNYLTVLVPNQNSEDVGKYTLSKDYYENCINDKESLAAIFFRIMIEKLNGVIFKMKMTPDRKLVTAIAGVIKFYYTNYSKEEKQNLIDMDDSKRLDYFEELGKPMKEEIKKWVKK